MPSFLKNLFCKKDVTQISFEQQRKKDRKQVSKLARTLMWSLRIFVACVMVITTYNVALAICDVMANNYILWLSSTIASCAFCAVSIAIICCIYVALKNLTKSLSKPNA